MLSKIQENFKDRKTITSLITGAVVFLALTIGAAYSYFSVTTQNNATNTTSTGALVSNGEVVLTTNTTRLHLSLDSVLMNENNIGSIYYATTDPTGTPITSPTKGNGIYTLATATANEGATGYDCTYSYSISGVLYRAINDGSDEDIKVTIKGDSITNNEETYTLKDILRGNQTLEGTFKEISHTTPQTITIESTVENTSDKQDDFKANNYSITLTPESFSCSYTIQTPIVKTAVSNDVVSLNITKGTYAIQDCCINDDPIDTTNCDWEPVNESMTMSLSSYGTFYAHVRDANGYVGHSEVISRSMPLSMRLIDDGNMWQSGLQGDGYRFIGSGSVASSTSPDNFMCFGTDDKDVCKADESKYLYRIIGVFEDAEGNNHVKLIKYKQLGAYAWNANRTVDKSWENSDMYKGLNGSYFLTNTTYDYMQNEEWSNKITNWTWSAVNTQTSSNSGPNYYNGVTTEKIYLHEMNRTNKTSSIGSWTTPTSKIGLMYASDYQMSLGVISLPLISYTNRETLITGWMHQSNSDTTVSIKEWIISRFGTAGDYWAAWGVDSVGFVDYYYVWNTYGVRPVFYLNSDVRYDSGTGDYTDPIIIK